MNYGILPPLTKEYIFERVSQEEIFEYYLGIKPDTDSIFYSPLRHDNNPTCRFYYTNDDKLKFRDLAGYFWGDCIDLVAYRINVNPNTKQGFMLALLRIAEDFKIHKFSSDYKADVSVELKPLKSPPVLPPKKVLITYQSRQWNNIDINYWFGKYKFSKKFMIEQGVIPIQYLFINNQLVYTYKHNDPAYVYRFNKENYKIYFPFRNKKQTRFLGNNKYAEGIINLNPCKICIITKSYKDVLTIRSLVNRDIIDAVSVKAETVILSKKEIDYIRELSDHQYSFFDYDYTGINLANKMRKIYGIQPIFITNGKFNTIDFKVKDISDFIEKYGIKQTKSSIEKVLKILGHHDITL